MAESRFMVTRASVGSESQWLHRASIERQLLARFSYKRACPKSTNSGPSCRRNDNNLGALLEQRSVPDAMVLRHPRCLEMALPPPQTRGTSSRAEPRPAASSRSPVVWRRPWTSASCRASPGGVQGHRAGPLGMDDLRAGSSCYVEKAGASVSS